MSRPEEESSFVHARRRSAMDSREELEKRVADLERCRLGLTIR
jgi:hypothetical protein